MIVDNPHAVLAYIATACDNTETQEQLKCID